MMHLTEQLSNNQERNGMEWNEFSLMIRLVTRMVVCCTVQYDTEQYVNLR